MKTVQVSDKGQITLPADARKRFGLKSKSRLEFEIRDDEIVLKPVKSILELSGCLQECAKGKTADWETIRSETEQIIAEEVAREGLD